MPTGIYERKSLAERLKKYQVRDERTGCLVFTGTLNDHGYGQISDGTGRLVGTHRAAAFLADIIPSLDDPAHVCHKCDNPPCTEPEHLYRGDRVSNMRDKSARGRYRNQNTQKTHCLNGHLLAGDNLSIVNRERRCRICYRERTKQYYNRKRA